MKDTVIITDSCANLKEEYINKYNIKIIPMSYRFDETIYCEENKLTSKEFYDRLRMGELPNTICGNVVNIKEAFLNKISDYKNIIYICFSSGLSSTYQHSILVKNELQQLYPNKNIYVLDSLTGSLAQGLMVMKAIDLIKEQMDYKDIINTLEKEKSSYQSDFIVGDLKHLKRGGRLNSASAFIGGVLNIKLLVHTDLEGKVALVSKLRGKKFALDALTSRVMETADFNYPIGIVHADNIIDANEVKNKLETFKQLKELIITELTPTIGAHLGANAVGITYKKNIKKR